MKTSNLTALMLALLVSATGFAGINFLFTYAYYSHQRASVASILPA
jgi:hypothetical protein